MSQVVQSFAVTREGRSDLINQTADTTTATMSFPFYVLATPFFSFELQFDLATELPSMSYETRQFLITRLLSYMGDLIFPATNFGVVINAQLSVTNQFVLGVSNQDFLGFMNMRLGYEEASGLSRGYGEGAGSSSCTVPRLEIKDAHKGKHEGEEVRCSVCLEDIIAGVEYTRFPCSHVFHQNCIDQWLERSMTCPNCRFDLEVEGEDDEGGFDPAVEERGEDEEGTNGH